MEKLKFKTLVKHQDISDFLDKIEHHSGVRLPIEYVKKQSCRSILTRPIGCNLHASDITRVQINAFRS